MAQNISDQGHKSTIEPSKATQWPSSPSASSENRAIASELISHVAPSDTTPKVLDHKCAGWSAQDCIMVEYLDNTYIVKVPRDHSAAAATVCKAEKDRVSWAADHDLGPKVVNTDKKSGAFAMQFIKGKILEDTKSVQQHMDQIMDLLQRFHKSRAMPGMVFWDPLARLQTTLNRANEKDCMGAGDILLVERVLSWARDGLNNVSDFEKVPCHNDYHNFNIVQDEEEKLWAIDYEECNLGDPMWDLGYLTATLELERYALADKYGGNGCTTDERDRLGYHYFVAMAYCGTWRAIRIELDPKWKKLHHDCMARLREKASDIGIALTP